MQENSAKEFSAQKILGLKNFPVFQKFLISEEIAAKTSKSLILNARKFYKRIFGTENL